MKAYFLKLFLIVVAYFFLLSSSSAQSKTDSLLKELKKPQADTMRVRILLGICDEGQVSKDSGFLFISNAMKLALKTNNAHALSQSYHYLCHWQVANLKNYDTILFYCHKHLEMMERLKFVDGMALACKDIGGAFTWNSLDSSMYYNLKSIELFNQAKSFDKANGVKINLANVYIETKRYAEAIVLLKETGEYFMRTGNTINASIAYNNMGECYLRMGDFINAEKSIKKISPTITTPYGISYYNCQLAGVYCAQGRLEEANKLYLEAIEIGKKNNLDYTLYMAYLGMADVCFKKEMWMEAKSYKKLSWNYSYKNQETEEAMYKMFYKCDSALGNYKTSLLSYQKFIAVRDSYQNTERIKNADALEAKYQNKEKQTKIEILSKEKEIQKADTEKQQLIRNSVIIICIIFFALAGLLFNRFKLKKKIESQQALLNERKRISSELHDDLGAQLSTARMFLNNLRNNSDASRNSVLIENSLGLIDSSINDLRKIMDDLQTSTLQEKGYVPATEELVNKINRLQQIKFTLTHHHINKRFNNKAEHNLFRITQELINNTLKYAQAKNVLIDLLLRDNKIVLMYEDDGVGFNLQDVKRGYGLSNIESRIQSIEGTVDFDSTPGKGFRTTIEIPLIYAGENV